MQLYAAKSDGALEQRSNWHWGLLQVHMRPPVTYTHTAHTHTHRHNWSYAGVGVVVHVSRRAAGAPLGSRSHNHAHTHMRTCAHAHTRTHTHTHTQTHTHNRSCAGVGVVVHVSRRAAGSWQGFACPPSSTSSQAFSYRSGPSCWHLTLPCVPQTLRESCSGMFFFLYVCVLCVNTHDSYWHITLPCVPQALRVSCSGMFVSVYVCFVCEYTWLILTYHAALCAASPAWILLRYVCFCMCMPCVIQMRTFQYYYQLSSGASSRSSLQPSWSLLIFFSVPGTIVAPFA